MEKTHEEIRIEFINNCILKPIQKASEDKMDFVITDAFVGRSIYLILVDNGEASDNINFMQKYFDKAESKLSKKSDVITAPKVVGKLSLKDMMKQVVPREPKTEEEHEEIILLAYLYVAQEWVDNARKTGVNFQESLKLD